MHNNGRFCGRCFLEFQDIKNDWFLYPPVRPDRFPALCERHLGKAGQRDIGQ